MIEATWDPKMGLWRAGRCLRSFLDVVCFDVKKYGAVGSHRDLVHCGNHDNHGMILEQMFFVHAEEILSACTEDIFLCTQKNFLLVIPKVTIG